MSTARVMRRAYDQAFSDIGINLAEATILAHLVDGQLTQSELARRVGTSRARIGGSIDSLVPKGAVRRVAHATDRRVWLVTLTDEGRAIWERSVAADRELRKRIRVGTTKKQREEIDKVLTLIQKNVVDILGA
ncbi:MarR family winged helix-turn-helix transcriptional regulator [Mycobacterium neumannii]|uniref:MarR family winged helix-turn-helix transcriptional regulator n=1 Tax=Mycobacterium neumannii TaxID=2048551 RepID=UPI00192F5DB7|nr:MarR family transcriptional regulator [Mycobacterium neumannii]